MKAYVTIVGHSIAVATTAEFAAKQFTEIIAGNALAKMHEAEDKGYVVKQISYRIAHVEVNQ